LLLSTAAANAIPNTQLRGQLEGRCTIARAWALTCRQGRGKPVGRIELEQSDKVSEAMIDATSELAESLNGDALAIIENLRNKAIKGFRAKSMDELEHWFESEGYISNDETLSQEDRERNTLLRTTGDAEPQEIRQVIQWLESGYDDLEV
jgi:hypothetical protein